MKDFLIEQNNKKMQEEPAIDHLENQRCER